MEYVLNLMRKPWGDWGILGEETSVPQKATILVVDFHTEITPLILSQFPNLKIVASPTTGHTHLKFNPVECGVRLFTLRGDPRLTEVRSVAEYTFKLILDAMRPETGPHHTLNGKMLGIIGYGRIGRHVGEIAIGFKMIPVWYDKTSKPEALQYLFQTADILTLHVDENPTSIGMITRELVDSMKPGAILINTARPSIVEDQVQDCPNYYSDFPGHVAGNTQEDRLRTDKILIERITQHLEQSSQPQSDLSLCY